MPGRRPGGHTPPHREALLLMLVLLRLLALSHCLSSTCLVLGLDETHHCSATTHSTGEGKKKRRKPFAVVRSTVDAGCQSACSTGGLKEMRENVRVFAAQMMGQKKNQPEKKLLGTSREWKRSREGERRKKKG